MLSQSWGIRSPERGFHCTGASFSGTEVRNWKQDREVPFQEELADSILSSCYLLLIGLSVIKAPQGRERNPYFTGEETEAEVKGTAQVFQAGIGHKQTGSNTHPILLITFMPKPFSSSSSWPPQPGLDSTGMSKYTLRLLHTPSMSFRRGCQTREREGKEI